MKGYIPIIALLLLAGLAASLKLQSTFSHYASTFSFLKGTKLTFVRDVKPVTIKYKYWFNSKKCDYNLRIYRSATMNNAQFNVFVASYYSFENTITIDENVQYGVDNGVIFLVKHRAEQRSHGIYQWRFTQAAGGLSLTKNIASVANSAFTAFMKTKGLPVDLSWIAGDPLRNF